MRARSDGHGARAAALTFGLLFAAPVAAEPPPLPEGDAELFEDAPLPAPDGPDEERAEEERAEQDRARRDRAEESGARRDRAEDGPAPGASGPSPRDRPPTPPPARAAPDARERTSGPRSPDGSVSAGPPPGEASPPPEGRGGAARFGGGLGAPGSSLVVEVLSGPGLAPDRARRLAEALRRRLRAARDLRPRGAVEPPESGERQKAERQLERGLEAFAELDLEAAETRLRDGLLGLFRLGLGPSRALAVEGAFAFGAAALYDGRGAEALGRFVLLARLDPDFRPSGVPDHVRARFERLAATVEDRRVGTLRVGSRPGGAEVVVDGRPRGRTPLIVEELADGVHAVAVRAPGFEPAASLVSVRGGAVATRLERLSPAPAPAPRVSVADIAVVSRARAAADRLGVAHLLGLRPAPGGGLSGVWLAPGPRAHRVVLERLPEDDDIAADLVVQAIAAATPLDADAPASGRPAGGGLDLPWWVWAAVGGAVVVAGGIAGTWAAVSEEETPPRRFPVLRF